ncbi:MAG: signal peptidase I [Erysipelothrix sp.]|jgi:signal peptidase I|nr:signal peptidase I [Erysipelothrix sp.]
MTQKKRSIFKEFKDLMKTAIISVVVVFAMTKLVIKPIEIEGMSMQPTLLNKQRGFSNILAHKITPIKRFDIVIIYDAIDRDYFVKRVVGLENEVIEFRNDVLYVNGEAIDQPFLDENYVMLTTNDHQFLFTKDFGPVKVKPNHVFVLGDNRLNSTDSRVRGAYPVKNIISKHIYIVYPFNQMRFYHN